MADADGGGRSVSGVLKFAALAISVVAGATTLLFTIDEDLKPCLGGYEAHFTGAPVFPNSDYGQHLKRGPDAARMKREGISVPPKNGAEVRATFSTSSLRGEELEIRSSLVRIKGSETLGPVDPDWDRQPTPSIIPDTCGETVGRDLFVEIPERTNAKYLVVLELYRGDERLALVKTDIFAN